MPDPENDYAKCVAAKRKATPAPAKGQPKVTDAQLKTQCKTEYEQLRNQVLQQLISVKWIQGEADAMGIKVTDAEVKKSFDEQKKQSFPKDADYQKYLKDSGQTQEDILAARQARAAVEQDPRQGRQGQGQGLRQGDRGLLRQEQGPLRAAGEARPARRADQDQGRRRQGASAALEDGDSWKAVAKKYSIDDTSKAAGGKLPAQAKGTLDKELDDAVFSADKGELVGPVKTQYGYYVFTVADITEASQQTLAEAKETIKQTLQSQEQQKALDAFVKDFTKRWREKTECSEGYKTTDCKNGPKATPTPVGWR